MDDQFYYLGFSAFSGIGPKRFRKLLDHFGTARSAWNADISELKKSGIGNSITGKFIKHKNDFPLHRFIKKLHDEKIKFFTWSDSGYPKLLLDIKNPPFVLYYKGEFDFSSFDKHKAIAVVGTRKITTYGTQVTQSLVNDLVQANCIIVSGMALGVDSVAHKTTIENNGKTIAVLGSGVDICTPADNISLYRDILQTGGCIVSEAPPGQEPVKGSFLSRNRIIAGLSDAVIVTEGASDSGALVTAGDALINNRKVFAIPGPITSNYSKGPNSLLAKGASLATCANDILKSFRITYHPRSKEITAGTPDEQKIISLLQNEQMHIDELIKHTNISAAKIGTVLSLMEMKGIIRSLGSGIFALTDIS